MASRIVVFGAGTRLAARLLALVEPRSRPLVLTARDPVEADALRGLRPDAELLLPDGSKAPGGALGGSSTAPWGEERVDIALCGFGLVHPERPEPERHLADLQRDLALLRAVLDRAGERPVRAVFVSSVVALAPARRRAYYGGLKNVAEAGLAAALSGRPGASLTVLFPGRLVEARRARAPATLLATPYDALARRILDLLDGRRGGNGAVGLDARLWLAARSAGLAGGAVLGTVAAPRPESRDAPPDSSVPS